MSPLLFVLPGNDALGESLCRHLGAERINFELRRFPDNETYLRIDSDVLKRDAVVLCSLHNPDHLILPLIYACDTLRYLGARQVGFVCPYLAYMRQDKRFHAGEALTSSSFAKLISAQFDWLTTVDPHLHRTRSLDEIYTIPSEVTHAAPLLSAWIGANVRKPLIVGPDSESEQWVRQVADGISAPYTVLEKIRHGDRNVSVTTTSDLSQWSEHTPVLVDDIISSARTMIETIRQFAEVCRIAPVCVGVHGLFAGEAFDELRAAGAERIVTTNSIQHPSNDIDLAPLLVPPIQRCLELCIRPS